MTLELTQEIGDPRQGEAAGRTADTGKSRQWRLRVLDT